MDYGYQLLRHVVQQVFGNFREAAQLTLLLFAMPVVGFVALTGGGNSIMTEPSGGAIFGLLLLVVPAAVAFGWAAVGWHRYVLLEETGNGILPVWRSDRVMAYLLQASAVVLIGVLGFIGAGIVIAIVHAVTGSVALTVVPGIGSIVGVLWLATRIGLVLPAAALGERMTIGESWAATRPVSSQILLPVIVIALVDGVIQQALPLLFGQSVMVETIGAMQEQIVLSLPGQVLDGVVSWLQSLVNLALMNTLYGNLIKGRQLN